MDKALNTNINLLFDHIIENSYNDINLTQKFKWLEDYLNENRQSISYAELNLERLFTVNLELYIRSMNYVIKKSLFELEILFLRVAISKADGFNKPCNSPTYPKLVQNIVQILLNCRLQEYLDMTMSKKFMIGNNNTILISYKDLKNDELFNLLNLAKDKYIEILTKDVCEIDENKISDYINKLNTVYKDIKSCYSIPTNMVLFRLDDLSYSEKNIETLFSYKQNISPTEYDTEIYNQFGILLLPFINDIKISKIKLTFLNNGFGVLDNGTLQILSENNEILNSYEIQTTFYQKEATIYLNLTNILKDLNLNSSIFFKIVFKKFSNKYTLVFRHIVGDLIDNCKSERGIIVNNIKIGNIENCSNVNIGNGTQNVNNPTLIKELEELIQQLKVNSLGEYAEQLENANKSNDINKTKSVLINLKKIVSGSVEMVEKITKIISIIDLVKNHVS